jgi:CO/xanthine dehydrogenase Mo-binding subunit
LSLLGSSPRHRAVLELAAEKAGWGTPRADGRARGAAVYYGHGGWAAQVAEVSVDAGGQVRVKRVVCAVDCGFVVNPDTVAAQIKGGIAFGLTAALKSAVVIEDGRVTQHGFHDYPLLTLAEMPKVEVHIVSSGIDPTGAGEAGVPPIAPAVANAVFAATGIRPTAPHSSEHTSCRDDRRRAGALRRRRLKSRELASDEVEPDQRCIS